MGKTDDYVPPDWTPIEVQYRAGISSVARIAKQFSINLSTLQRHAGKMGWKRDLGQKVRAATQELVAFGDDGYPDQDQPRPDNRESPGEHEGEMSDVPASESVVDVSRAPAHPDAAVIAAASRLQADVIREHRRDILSGQRLCKDMIAGLSKDEPVIDEIVDDIEKAHPGSKQWKTRERMLRAVARPTRAATLRSLTAALAELVKLERQTFNMDAERGDETSATVEERVKGYERAAAIDASGGRVVPLTATGGAQGRPAPAV